MEPIPTQDFKKVATKETLTPLSNVTSFPSKDDTFVYYGRTAKAIAKEFKAANDDWPKRVGGKLFTLNPDPPKTAIPTADDLNMISSPTQLFAYAHGKSHVHWLEGHCTDSNRTTPMTAVTKSEFYIHLLNTTKPNYDTVEFLPHYPPLSNSYYLPYDLPEATGEYWDEFVSHLNADSEMDSQLIQAVTLQHVWGGGPGLRPGVVFLSDHGVESGKTVTAHMVAEGFGKIHLISSKMKWDKAETSLMSSDFMGRRTILIDNVKTRMDNSGLESLITSTHIAGWQLYVGHVSVPNYTTVLITANKPNLSKDLVSRCIMIKIGPPIKSNTHKAWQEHFFSDKQRPYFIADVMAKMAMQKSTLASNQVTDRWGPWQTDILTRFPNALEIAQHIDSVRKFYDVDLKKAIDVARTIKEHVDNVRSTHKELIGTPYKFSIEALCSLLIHKKEYLANSSASYIKTSLMNLRECPVLQPLNVDPKDARFWIWTPPQAALKGPLDI